MAEPMTRKWSEVRRYPRLTKARRNEIERHAAIGGNASAAMVTELLHEIDALTAQLAMANAEATVARLGYPGHDFESVVEIVADGTKGMERGR